MSEQTVTEGCGKLVWIPGFFILGVVAHVGKDPVANKIHLGGFECEYAPVRHPAGTRILARHA